jgi:hypothetical protein
MVYDPVKIAAENGYRLEQFGEGRWVCQIGNHRTYSISARHALVTELNRLGKKKVIAKGRMVTARKLADDLLSLPVALSAAVGPPTTVQSSEPPSERTLSGGTPIDVAEAFPGGEFLCG